MATEIANRNGTFGQSAPVTSSVAKILHLLADWAETRAERRRERQAIASLKGLSDYALKDIGVHRSEVSSIVHDTKRERKHHYEAESSTR